MNKGPTMKNFFALACAASLIGVAHAQQGTPASGTAVTFQNLSIEDGAADPAAWTKGGAVPGVEQLWDKSTAHSGKASLCLKKTAQTYFPVAQWSQSVTVQPAASARKLQVKCWVKADKATKAIIDVPYSAGTSGHNWAIYIGQKQKTDPVANHDWKLYEGVVEIPAQTSKVGIAFQIYGPGTVWFDDLQIAWAP